MTTPPATCPTCGETFPTLVYLGVGYCVVCDENRIWPEHPTSVPSGTPKGRVSAYPRTPNGSGGSEAVQITESTNTPPMGGFGGEDRTLPPEAATLAPAASGVQSRRSGYPEHSDAPQGNVDAHKA